MKDSKGAGQDFLPLLSEVDSAGAHCLEIAVIIGDVSRGVISGGPGGGGTVISGPPGLIDSAACAMVAEWMVVNQGTGIGRTVGAMGLGSRSSSASTSSFMW